MTQTRQNHVPLLRRLMSGSSILWLVPALLVTPALLLGALFEEDNLANAAQSLATSAIIWFPCFGLIAIVTPHFRSIQATLATLLFFGYDSLRSREILYELIDPRISLSGNPNWITLVVIVGTCLVLAVVTLLRPTLFRVVVLTASAAQIATLILFHSLTVVGPIAVERDNERSFISGLVAAEGSPAILCEIDGRSCHRGEPLALADRLDVEMLNPGSITRLLRDEAATPSLLFGWTESAFAATADEAMRHITIFKDDPDSVMVLINELGPTRAFTQMKLAFSILAGAFQQAWMTLVLLILWRHRDYTLKAWRWTRAA